MDAVDNHDGAMTDGITLYKEAPTKTWSPGVQHRKTQKPGAMDRYHEGTHGPRTVAVIGCCHGGGGAMADNADAGSLAPSCPLVGQLTEPMSIASRVHCALPMCTLYAIWVGVRACLMMMPDQIRGLV